MIDNLLVLSILLLWALGSFTIYKVAFQDGIGITWMNKLFIVFWPVIGLAFLLTDLGTAIIRRFIRK